MRPEVAGWTKGTNEQVVYCTSVVRIDVCAALGQYITKMSRGMTIAITLKILIKHLNLAASCCPLPWGDKQNIV